MLQSVTRAPGRPLSTCSAGGGRADWRPPPGAAPRTPRDLSPEPAGVQAAVPYVRLATQRKAPRPCQVGRCLDVKAAQYLRTGIDLSVTLSLGKGRL